MSQSGVSSSELNLHFVLKLRLPATVSKLSWSDGADHVHQVKVFIRGKFGMLEKVLDRNKGQEDRQG